MTLSVANLSTLSRLLDEAFDLDPHSARPGSPRCPRCITPCGLGCARCSVRRGRNATATFWHAAPGDEHLTKAQGRMLTPHYASPEQLRGETITVATDVYSLSVLLYELLAGCLPHVTENKSMAALEEAMLEGEAPPASSRAQTKEAAKALRGELDAILAKALKCDPSQRYATRPTHWPTTSSAT